MNDELMKESARMNQAQTITLTKHRLHHIKELTVDPILFSRTFEAGCSMGNCNATCCKYGVYADLEERDRILAHTELIQRHLEPDQEHDPAQWFDPEIEDDRDFPSGKAIGTQARERGCVFLRANGLCSLQAAATQEGMDKFFLKPFYCVAFPIVIVDGMLTIDEPDFTNRKSCCSTVPRGELHALDLCEEELEFILGREGLKELKTKAQASGLL